MASSGLIERQAIGRAGIIGSLYDIRTDQFVMGNLFKSELPPSFLQTTDCANVSYWLDFHNSQKETFNNLNIEAHLKIGLMAGLFSLEGSAKYLKQTKTDSKTVRTTFIYKMKTKQEDLLVSSEHLHEYFSSYAFENPDVTHVVIGIKWGANVAATFERTVDKHEDVTRIEGELAATFANPLLNISGEAKVQYDDQERKDIESLKISFSGDVMIEDCPQTIDGVLEVYRKVPLLIKTLNHGKGQQLTFILCSLKQIAEMTKFERRITRLVKEVSEDMVNRIEDIFEQMNEERKKLNDFLDEIKPWKEYIPRQWFHSIKQKLADFDVEELKLKRQLSKLLIEIRSGSTEESQMTKLLDDFNTHPCSPISIENFFQENERIQMKIKTLKRISPDKKELITNISSIEDFIQDFYHDEVYLLHICEQWQQEDQENSTKQTRFFINLKENDKAKFWVIDYDLHSRLQNKPTNSVIYYATNAVIKSRDFYKDSFYKLSRKQIELILEENSNITEQWLIDRHEQFLKDHHDAELSERDWIDEFRRIFPKGNPQKFCEFAFPAIDKNKNGKIDFTEFMTAVALTHPGNLETRLRLVFSVCDYDDSGTINAGKMIKFIEVIAELNDGPSAVNTDAAKSVAEQIMKTYNKQKDGVVTKEEFINCCKRNVKITTAFLPDEEINRIDFHLDRKWKQHGITIAGGNGQGYRSFQLSLPHGICIDDDGTIYIADCSNDRIVQWKPNATKGEIVAGGNRKGNRLNQLNCPTDVIIDHETNSLIIADRDNRRVMRWSRQNKTEGEILISDIDCSRLAMGKQGSLFVSDWKKDEVRRWRRGEKGEGRIVAGGNGQGDHANQLNHPTSIFVDDDALYISDSNNNRVMKWIRHTRKGIVVAGGNGQGHSWKQLSKPQKVFVDQFGQIYVVDCGNSRVMRWPKDGKEGRIVVGRNGEGAQSNQFNHPKGLAFDRDGNLYIADSGNHRIQKFEVE